MPLLFQYDGVTFGTTTGPGNGTDIVGTNFTFSANGDNQISGDRNNHSDRAQWYHLLYVTDSSKVDGLRAMVSKQLRGNDLKPGS